ncbi:MAG TPA: cytochrome P450 [Ktedonobacteraceae bacterium]|jgi:cytochrome P450
MKNTTLPPSPKGLPIVGNAFQFNNGPLAFLRSVQRIYPRMATIYVGKEPLVLCFRPEHIRAILVENPRNFVKPNRAGARFNLRLLLGDGLLTIDGEFHRQQRRLVQSAFHKHRIETYAETMVQLTQEELATWQPYQVINIAQAMQRLTLRIILNALFNLDSSSEAIRLGDAFTALTSSPTRQLVILRRLQRKLPFTSYSKRIAAKQTLDNFVYTLIAQRRAEGQDVGDVLSMLLEAQDEGNTMTDQQVHDQVLTFIAAGHETAQNTLSWTFYLLSQHPAVYEKLLAQLRSVLNGRAPTMEDLAQLPYLEWVINESWRIYPPAWVQGRRAIEDFELDGYRFPAGTVFLLSQWVLHNLPDIWGDPEVFRPERWDPVQTQKVPQGAYFPFGAGPRICIGMPFAQLETKLLLATILQHYRPRLAPDFRVVFEPRVTLRPKYGMRMVLEPVSQVSSLTV